MARPLRGSSHRSLSDHLLWHAKKAFFFVGQGRSVRTVIEHRCRLAKEGGVSRLMIK